MYGELRDELRVTVSLWQGKRRSPAVPRLSAVKLSMSVWLCRSRHATSERRKPGAVEPEIPNLYRAVVELHTADGTLLKQKPAMSVSAKCGLKMVCCAERQAVADSRR